MPGPQDDAARRTRAWAAAAAALALALYAPTLGHGFTFDDDIVIVKNRLVRSLASLPALVARTEWSGGGFEVPAYRPLTDATYALNHAVSGLTPWSYHLANVLLHALAAALVAVLGARLGLSPAAAGVGALLFAAHPLHVESVANVVGRKDVLATVFLLAMMLLHARARAGSVRHGALAALAYAGAMLSKEVGVVGIGLAFVLDRTLAAGPDEASGGARPPAHRLPLYAAYAGALGLYLLAFRAVTSGAPPFTVAFQDNPVHDAALPVRLMTAVAVIGKGLLLHLLPLAQSPDYSYAAILPVTSPLDPRLLGAVAALAAWAAAAVALRRRAPVVAWSLAWYLLGLLPASNLLFPIGTIFGERLLYLPGVALALLAGAGAAAAASRLRLPRPAAVAIAAAALLALSVATVRYSAAWADEEQLFRTAVANQPASTKVHHKLALVVADRDPAQALEHMRRALAISEPNLQAHLAEATILRKLGRPAEEERALRRALELGPGNADALYGLGRLAREAGRVDEAVTWWRRALAADPRHAAALADLATWHLVRGELAPAFDLASRAVAADDGLASAWYNLALVHQARGERARARFALERFVATAGPEYAPEVAQVRAQLAR
jgi:Tfp pilus assembly protein PilF